jgi:riboflavin kinase/FMN adenylyltransferase
LEIWEYSAFPAAGVYACLVTLKGERYPAVTNIGIRPTFDEDLSAPIIEAHLLDFKGDLYGVQLDMQFVARLRGEQRFEGPQALQKQIDHDIARARQVLAKEDQDGATA